MHKPSESKPWSPKLAKVRESWLKGCASDGAMSGVGDGGM